MNNSQQSLATSSQSRVPKNRIDDPANTENRASYSLYYGKILTYHFTDFKREFGIFALDVVILSERSESKDLRTDFTTNMIAARRSLDSISFRSG